jgi:hypothetical protein
LEKEIENFTEEAEAEYAKMSAEFERVKIWKGNGNRAGETNEGGRREVGGK